MIRNLVFDMGNVLIRFDPDFFMDRAGIRSADLRQRLWKELFHSVEWAQMDLGILTEESAEPLILVRFPEEERPTVSHLLWHWADDREQIPGMEEFLRELKEKGYRLFLLSNASVSQHDYWPRFPVSRFFEGTLISCDVKVVKPCPEIYRLLTRKFSLLPEECLFIDDAPSNVAGAIACGWQGIVFQGDATELKQKIQKLLDLTP